MYRQGDVLLVPVANPPSRRQLTSIQRQKGEGVILAAGEATGHHHRVRESSAHERRVTNNEQAARSGLPRGTRLLYVDKRGASLTHEEHDTIPLPPGVFRVVQQREYEPVIVDNTVRQSERAVYD